MSVSNISGPHVYVRLIIGLAALAAAAWWASSTWTRTVELGNFLEYEEQPMELYALIDSGDDSSIDVPAAAEARLLMASIYGREFFPPDDRSAARWAALALLSRPLESGLWVILANHLFFSGQDDDARTALRRADELDPNYPLQRLSAIRLWTLMGERERAGILAAQIGRLGGRERGDAARELLRAGWERSEIFVRLEGPSLSTPAMIDLLQILRTTNPEQCRALLETMPIDRLRTDRTLRVAVSRHAVDARLLDQAEMLWRLERPEAPPHPRFPADHEDLQLALVRPPLSMGWQGPPAENWVILRPRVIEEPSIGGRPGPRTDGLEVQYRDTPDESRRHSRWPFYRVPVPENEELHVAMRVRTIPSNRSAASIVASEGRNRVESNTTDLRTDLYQILELTVPPQPYPRFVTLQLNRTRARSMFDTEAELLIQSLNISTSPPRPVEAESDEAEQ